MKVKEGLLFNIIPYKRTEIADHEGCPILIKYIFWPLEGSRATTVVVTHAATGLHGDYIWHTEVSWSGLHKTTTANAIRMGEAMALVVQSAQIEIALKESNATVQETDAAAVGQDGPESGTERSQEV